MALGSPAGKSAGVVGTCNVPRSSGLQQNAMPLAPGYWVPQTAMAQTKDANPEAMLANTGSGANVASVTKTASAGGTTKIASAGCATKAESVKKVLSDRDTTQAAS